MDDKDRTLKALEDMKESMAYAVRRKQQIHEAVPIANGGASTEVSGTPLTDLQLTKLCAEAMGYMETQLIKTGAYNNFRFEVRTQGKGWQLYDPLHDSAQAFALIERFGLSVWGHGYVAGDWKYHAEWGHPDDYHALGHGFTHNEAIVRCIAQMQVDRTKTSTVAQDK